MATGVTRWTNDAGTSYWFDPGNWTNGVPTADTAAVLPSSTSSYTVTIQRTSGAIADNITVGSGARLNLLGSLTADVHLEAGGIFINTGGNLKDGELFLDGGTVQTYYGPIFDGGTLTYIAPVFEDVSAYGTLVVSGGGFRAVGATHVYAEKGQSSGGLIRLQSSTGYYTQADLLPGQTVELNGGTLSKTLIGNNDLPDFLIPEGATITGGGNINTDSETHNRIIIDGTIVGGGTYGLTIDARDWHLSGSVEAPRGSDLRLGRYDGQYNNTDVVDGVLLSGTYIARSDARILLATGEVSSIARAIVTLDGGDSEFRTGDTIDESGTQGGDRPLEETLTTVEAGGRLNLLGGRSFFAWNELHVSGGLRLEGGSFGGNGIILDDDGGVEAQLSGSGQIDVDVTVEYGAIEADGGTLVFKGDVRRAEDGSSSRFLIASDATLSFDGAAEGDVVFEGTGGHLKLSDPTQFRGAITGSLRDNYIDFGDYDLSDAQLKPGESGGPAYLELTPSDPDADPIKIDVDAAIDELEARLEEVNGEKRISFNSTGLGHLDPVDDVVVEYDNNGSSALKEGHFTITNTGGETLIFDGDEAIRSDDLTFSYPSILAQQGLGPGQSATIDVYFNSSDELSPGRQHGVLTIEPISVSEHGERVRIQPITVNVDQDIYRIVDAASAPAAQEPLYFTVGRTYLTQRVPIKVANNSPQGEFSMNLDVDTTDTNVFGDVRGVVGSLPGKLTPGQSDGHSISAVLDTSTVGAKSGSLYLSLDSYYPLDDAGGPAFTSVQSIPVKATILNHAQLGVESTVDLGTFELGFGSPITGIVYSNIAQGPADLLRGNYTVSGSNLFSFYNARGDRLTGRDADEMGRLQDLLRPEAESYEQGTGEIANAIGKARQALMSGGSDAALKVRQAFAEMSGQATNLLQSSLDAANKFALLGSDATFASSFGGAAELGTIDYAQGASGGGSAGDYGGSALKQRLGGFGASSSALLEGFQGMDPSFYAGAQPDLGGLAGLGSSGEAAGLKGALQSALSSFSDSNSAVAQNFAKLASQAQFATGGPLGSRPVVTGFGGDTSAYSAQALDAVKSLLNGAFDAANEGITRFGRTAADMLEQALQPAAQPKTVREYIDSIPNGDKVNDALDALQATLDTTTKTDVLSPLEAGSTGEVGTLSFNPGAVGTYAFTITYQPRGWHGGYIPDEERLPTQTTTYIARVVKRPPDPPPAPDGPVYASTYGDVHYLTFDGVRYDLQAVGEFQVVKSVLGEEFDVQARTVMWGPTVSVTQQLAIKLGEERVTIDSVRDESLFVDGAARQVAVGDSIEVGSGTVKHLTSNEWLVTTAAGESVSISDAGDYLDASYAISGERPDNSIVGLLGNFDADYADEFQLRNGSVVSGSVSDIHRLFGESWRLTQAESLLDYGPGETTESFTVRGFPVIHSSISDFPPEAIAAATAFVEAAGITDPIARKDAIFDYLVTGDRSFVEATQAREEAGVVGLTKQENPAAGSSSDDLRVGISPKVASVEQRASGTTTAQFTVFASGRRTGDLTLEYAVSPKLGDSFFAGTEVAGRSSTGTITIPADVSSVDLSFEVPDVGAVTDKALRVEVKLPQGTSGTVIAQAASVEILNDDPVHGIDAVAGFAAANGGILNGSGTNWTLDLGTPVQGQAFYATLGVANLGAAGANELDGAFSAASGDTTIISTAGSVDNVQAGRYGAGLSVSGWALQGRHSATVLLNGTQANASGFSAALTPVTLTLTYQGLQGPDMPGALTIAGAADDQAVAGSQIAAVATDGNGISDAVTYSFKVGDNAAVVNTTGVFTPPGNTAGQTLTIEASYRDDQGYSGALRRTVQVIASENPPSTATYSIANAPTVTEGGTLSFVASRSGDTSQAADLDFTVGGTATGGLDYTALSGPVHFEAGSSFATVRFMTFDDQVVEATENVTVTLRGTPTGGGQLGTSVTAFGDILDNDTPAQSGGGNPSPASGNAGSTGADSLLGTSGSDTIAALGGDDTIDGGPGADMIYGNQGNDRIVGQPNAGSDTVYGGQDNDTVDYAASSEPQLIYGNLGDDSVMGGAASDKLYGGQGNDVAYGGRGGDQVYGNLGGDLIYGNQGSDTVYGGQGIDRMYGGQDSDIVYGNLGGDAIYGNLGNDSVYGGQGDDVLYSGQGDDLLFGGVGNDTLAGGLGADRFVFGRDNGADLIIGFDAGSGDRLDFVGQAYTFAADGNATVFTLAGGGTVRLENVQASTVGQSFFA